jgi:hypothetical protein
VVIHGRKSVAVGVIVGLAVFAASALVASPAVAPSESPLFRLIDGLPDSLYQGIWQFIQFGVFVVIPFLIVVASVTRRAPLAMTIGWIWVQFLAKVAPGWVASHVATLVVGVPDLATAVLARAERAAT